LIAKDDVFSAHPQYTVGARVEANTIATYWFKGKIVAMANNGMWNTYAIQFDDGEYKADLPAIRIRELALGDLNTPPKKNPRATKEKKIAAATVGSHIATSTAQPRSVAAAAAPPSSFRCKHGCGTVRVFGQKFTVEDAIGSHA
jgi:hypothetical protein